MQQPQPLPDLDLALELLSIEKPEPFPYRWRGEGAAWAPLVSWVHLSELVNALGSVRAFVIVDRVNPGGREYPIRYTQALGSATGVGITVEVGYHPSPGIENLSKLGRSGGAVRPLINVHPDPTRHELVQPRQAFSAGAAFGLMADWVAEGHIAPGIVREPVDY